MKQVHIFVSGFVQGVGYRAYVRSKARKLGLTGWVRNLSDGRVEAVLQGEKDKINSLIRFCKRGSYFADVKDIVVTDEHVKEKFINFEKLPTL